MNELRKLAKIRDVADIKDVALDVAGKAAGQFGERLAREKMSQLVDKLTVHLNSAITGAGLDPILVPESNATFTAQVACLPLPGTARLHDGNVKGLATVRRHQGNGEAGGGLAIRVEGSSRVFVDFDLAIGPVTASVAADVGVCCMNAAPGFSIACDAVVLRLRFNGDLAEKRLTVTEFRLEDLPQLRTEVTGMDGGAMRNWIQPLVDQVVEMEHQRLVDVAKGKVMELVKGYIEDPQSIKSLF